MKMVRLMEKRSKTIFSAAALFLVAATGVALASSGGEHEAVKHVGWLATDTYRVMNFVVLAVALFYVARKPVAEFFSSRAKGIAEELEGLEAKKAEAEKTLSEYAAKIADLDKESDQIIADYIKQGEAAKARILAEAENQAAKLEEMARRNIEQEFKNAKAMLQQEIAAKALERAETLVKETISAEDQDRLVDDYLNRVVAS